MNFVDHQLTAQSSIIRFVEGTWRLRRLGDQSPGASSATLDGMFDFRHPHHSPFILDPTSGDTADACTPDAGHPVELAADDLSGRAHDVPVAAVVVLTLSGGVSGPASPR